MNKKSISTDVLDKAIDNALNISSKLFPIKVFPRTIQELIKNAETTTLFDPDFFSAGILSTAATAIGTSVILDNGSYLSKPIFWISIIGRTGTGKTHPLQFAKNPIETKDKDLFEEYKNNLDEYEKHLSETKEKKPVYSKFILKDFTPEKLASSLQYNEKGVMIFQDELMGWINSFDQYKKGGEQQLYLELFNGNELTVDRVTKDPIRIEQTNVNILGGMQPELLKGMAKNNRNNDGFLDRFLFVYPDNSKPKLFTGFKIKSEHKTNYHKLISNLLDCPKQQIKAGNDVIELFKEWQHEKVKEFFSDHLEASLQSKLETYVWRVALVLEMMSQANICEYTQNLSKKSLSDAIQVVEYFRFNALKAHDIILTKNPFEGLSAAQRDLYDNLPKHFKRNDIIPLFVEKEISVRSGDRFLKNNDIFYNSNTHKDLKQGQYTKKIF
jgi:hypothetical protein